MATEPAKSDLAMDATMYGTQKTANAPVEGRTALEDLQRIPGVGKAVARDLWSLGVRTVDDLRGHDPEALYERLCALQGGRVDRCMLYTFRCAVYFASTQLPEPELLKWWNWKDRG